MIGDQKPITAATEQLFVIYTSKESPFCGACSFKPFTSEASMIKGTIVPSLRKFQATATARFLNGTVLTSAIRSSQ